MQANLARVNGFLPTGFGNRCAGGGLPQLRSCPRMPRSILAEIRAQSIQDLSGDEPTPGGSGRMTLKWRNPCFAPSQGRPCFYPDHFRSLQVRYVCAWAEDTISRYYADAMSQRLRVRPPCGRRRPVAAFAERSSPGRSGIPSSPPSETRRYPIGIAFLRLSRFLRHPAQQCRNGHTESFTTMQAETRLPAPISCPRKHSMRYTR